MTRMIMAFIAAVTVPASALAQQSPAQGIGYPAESIWSAFTAPDAQQPTCPEKYDHFTARWGDCQSPSEGLAIENGN